MRTVPLTNIKGGINRQRTKGGARADVLYDAVNCYETDAGTMRSRPGSERIHSLGNVTRGLCAYQGKFHVFWHETVSITHPDFVLHVLQHPSSTDSELIALEKIRFAEPFMGFLYVVAEFENGDVYHYWLQTRGEWAAETTYSLGDVVEPTTPNGLFYRATRLGSPNQAWSPDRPRAIGDVIEPTEYNDYYYTVVDTIGDNPVSGSTEPDWPEVEGAQVFEDTEGFSDETVGVVSTPTTPTPGEETQERYGRPNPRGVNR